MKINLKRGLFRAWVLVSSLWIAILLYYTVQAGSYYFSLRQVAAKHRAETDKTKVEHGPWEDYQKKTHTYTVTDPSSGKTIKLKRESAPTEAELDKIFTEVNAGKSGGLTEAESLELDSLEAENAKARFMFYFLMLLLPPPLLLGLGITINWVVEGFRAAP